ncbi:hypothetical protein V5799_032930 [Amblyomma americanum]|uniref:Uncharacterized protein n=1 Tax=Amblyomma americanum TaxID=6943 RepID=A0AAQ4DPS3_AMBAM
MLANMENKSSRTDFPAHELLPLLLRIREVWWVTQRHVAGNFLSLYQKYEDTSDQWIMAMREVTYRTTIAILDQALYGDSSGTLECDQVVRPVPVVHTKVTVIVTKIWEEVMVQIRQVFKECREKFEEAILADHGL